MALDNSDIVVSIEKSVALVTLNRPSKRNAVSLSMWRRLAEIYRELSDTPEVRVAILTGAGGNFCAGADISEFGEVRSTPEAVQAYEHAADAATMAIRDWRGPTIAAISGFAMGGGCGLALACDFRVADRSARMGIPAARLGIVYGALDCSLLHRQVGLAGAKRILFSGKPLTVDESAQIGLVDIPAADSALGAAVDLARSFVENAPLTLRGVKFILNAIADGSIQEKEKDVADLVQESFASEDYREGRTAFMEKRQPRFAGR